jgi:hypothetical protein
LRCAIPQSRWSAEPLDCLARAVKTPTLKDGYDVLLAVVALPAAPGREAGAKVTAARSHAVAWRVTFGTETVGFLELAIFGLRAIEHPARAVALTTEMIAVQSSYPSLRTASPFLDVRKRLLRDARGFRELCRWDIPFYFAQAPHLLAIYHQVHLWFTPL